MPSSVSISRVTKFRPGEQILTRAFVIFTVSISKICNRYCSKAPVAVLAMSSARSRCNRLAPVPGRRVADDLKSAAGLEVDCFGRRTADRVLPQRTIVAEGHTQ